jgi:hypothetical protein
MKILDNSEKGKKGHRAKYEEYTHKRCTKCGDTKPVDEFYKKKSRTKLGWSYSSSCAACNREFCSSYAVGNRPKRNQRLREYRKKNPDKVRALDRRKSYKKNYGISLGQLEALKARFDYACWICKRKPKKLVLDHCHKTGRVRGILCSLCNTYLGVIGERLEAVENLKNYLISDEPCHADLLLRYANPQADQK